MGELIGPAAGGLSHGVLNVRCGEPVLATNAACRVRSGRPRNRVEWGSLPRLCPTPRVALLVLALLGGWVGAPSAGLGQDEGGAGAEPEGALETEPAVTVEEVPPDPEQVWAKARLEAIPAWGARTDRALARVELATSYFAGATRLSVAFPDLADAPTERLGWLDAALDERMAAESDRVRERSQPVPELGDAERVGTWVAARDAALDAEDLAGSLERRLLLALRALAIDHPAIAGDGLIARRGALEAQIADLDARAREAEPGPARTALLASLGRTERTLQRLERLAIAARWRGTVPAAPSPLDRDDLTRLLEPIEATAAADRLARVRPLLGRLEGGLVDGAMARWLDEIAIPEARAALEAGRATSAADLPPREQLVAAVTNSRIDVELLEGELALLPPRDPARPPTLQRRVAERAIERARLVQALAQHRLEVSLRKVEDSVAEEEAETARQRAEAARKEAEAAASEASDETSRQVAAILKQLADAEAKSQEAWDTTQVLEQGFAAETRAWSDPLRAMEAELAAISEMSSALGSDRRDRIRKAWSGLHEQLQEVRLAAIGVIEEVERARERKAKDRAATLDERSAIEVARTATNAMPAGTPRAEAEQSLDVWEAALGSRNEAVERGLAVAEGHRQTTFQTLRKVKDLRRALRPSVPASERVDRDRLVSDLQAEVRLLAPNLRTLVRRRLAALSNVPHILGDPSALVSTLARSVWMLAVLVVGLWIRARVPRMVEASVSRIGAQERRLIQRDFKPLVQPLTSLAVAGLDLVVLTLLLDPVRARLPELAIVLVILRIAVLFRLLDAGFRLAVAPNTERRPSLIKVRETAWPLIQRAERLMILWLLVGTLVQYLLGEVIGAESLAWVAAQVFAFAVLGLTVFLLHLAEPHVTRAVREDVPDGRLRQLLIGHASSGFLLRAPRALAGSLLILGLRAWELVQGNVSEGSIAGQILNVVNRHRLTRPEDAPDVVVKLDPELARALSGPVTVASASLLFPGTLAAMDKAFATWKEESSRGMVLLIGDRGQGRESLIGEWARKTAEAGELELKSARIDGRLLEERALVARVGTLFGLAGCVNEESLVAALAELPPTLFVLEDLEYAFLRRVGGFSALRALFRSINAACGKHFWMIAMHGPAWRLLARLGTVVSTNSFREVIELPRLGGGELQEFLLGRTMEHGYTADFGPLSRASAANVSQSEVDRTTEAFFRLLADAASGNAGVAARLWAESLSPTEGADSGSVLRVRLPDSISKPQTFDLEDAALLTLAAVRVHGGLTAAEIVEANNIEQDSVQGTLQVLENMGLVEHKSGRYRIQLHVLAAVTRLLRRRHFVYGKDVT